MAPKMILSFLTVALVFGSTHALFDCHKNTICGSCTTSKEPCCWDPYTSKCSQQILACFNKNQTGHDYNCPTDPPNSFVYTDDFGRNKALPFIAATFGNFDQAKTCLNNRLPGVELVDQCEQQNCSGILALNSNDKSIVVSFRGSKGLEQFLLTGLDLLTGAKVNSPVGDHTYLLYYSCFFGLWKSGLGAKLQELKTAHADYELWAFGHSLGGSLASLTSAYSVHQKLFTSNEVKLVTTGATRTGNLEYAQAHDKLVPNSYRIMNVGDWITQLPPKIVYDDAGAFHHRFEVWYPTSIEQGAQFQICDQAEDSMCSASILNYLSSGHHNTYFNVPLDTWYETGCQYGQ